MEDRVNLRKSQPGILLFAVIMALLLLNLSGCEALIHRTIPKPGEIAPQQGDIPTVVTDYPGNSLDEDEIKAARAEYLGTDVSDLTIVIGQINGSQARGGDEHGYFLAARVDGHWQIVADGQGGLDCQALSEYGFPAPMVPECSPTPTPLSDEEALKTALAAHLGRNQSELNITINERNGSYARGGVDNGYFLAVRNESQWQIVADGQGALDCQGIAQYEFPASMVPECSPTPTPPSDEDAIKAVLAAYLGGSQSELNITVGENTGSHARGGVDNGYFLAVKLDGQWQIVADGQGALDCQEVAQYGFPASMVPECPPPSDSVSAGEISFKTGGTYGFIQGTIQAGETRTHTLQAMAGQTLIIGVASPDKDVFVGVAGIQGGQKLFSNDEVALNWIGTLPQTQDYRITLTTQNPDTYYFLEVEIPVDIRFDPGAYSDTVYGHIELLENTPTTEVVNHVTYLLYASAGQTMDVRLNSPNLDALSLGVYGKDDGQAYRRYQVKSYGYYGVLPLTQGYYLEVFSNGVSTDFSLDISIW
jgi:hypothetical protein